MEIKPLNFNSREQLYYQLYDKIFQDIINGKYKIGSLLPAERELISTYHVSRATVRKAMEMLANDGMIEKKRGHGTYVKNLKPKTYLNKVINYTKKNISNKTIAYKKVLDFTEIHANKKLSTFLNVPEGTPLIKLKRIRYADKEPMYIEINYFEKNWLPDLLTKDFSKESLRAFLMNQHHISWLCAHQKIYSITATEELATLLSIKPHSPLLYINRISYDINNIPREFVETYYRADNYYLEIDLSI